MSYHMILCTLIKWPSIIGIVKVKVKTKTHPIFNINKLNHLLYRYPYDYI